MPDQQIHLAPHVRACRIDEQLILLDLKRGRYVSVTARALSLFDSDTEDSSRVATGTLASSPGGKQLMATLLSRGLATEQSVATHTVPPLEEALSSMNANDIVLRPALRAARVYRFLASAACTAVSLRCRTLLAIEESVATKRMRQAENTRVGSPAALLEAVAAFERLRPLLFASRDKCLFDSLALIHFLAREGHFPRWVVGVTTRPFGAHSWVQDGTTVLNDQHEHVRAFRPILVV